MARQHYSRHFPDRTFPGFPQAFPSTRAGNHRPSPSCLWPANTMEDLSPAVLSLHFPKRSPSGRAGYPRPSPNRRMARQHYGRQFPDRIFPAFPQAGARGIPDRPRAVYGAATLRQTFPRPGFPSISPAGYPRPSPSRLWPVNITKGFPQPGFSIISPSLWSGYSVRIARHIRLKYIVIH